MRIKKMIKELKKIKSKHGNIKIIMTGLGNGSDETPTQFSVYSKNGWTPNHIRARGKLHLSIWCH